MGPRAGIKTLGVRFNTRTLVQCGHRGSYRQPRDGGSANRKPWSRDGIGRTPLMPSNQRAGAVPAALPETHRARSAKPIAEQVPAAAPMGTSEQTVLLCRGAPKAARHTYPANAPTRPVAADRDPHRATAGRRARAAVRAWPDAGRGPSAGRGPTRGDPTCRAPRRSRTPRACSIRPARPSRPETTSRSSTSPRNGSSKSPSRPRATGCAEWPWPRAGRTTRAPSPTWPRSTGWRRRFADAWGNRGWYLILLGRWDEARQVTAKAQALDPRQLCLAPSISATPICCRASANRHSTGTGARCRWCRTR